jgi:hypothetical protein
MKKLVCLAAALAAPAAASAQDVCAAADRRTRGMPRYGAAVMAPPVFGEERIEAGPQAAARGLILARQPLTIAPLLRYLAAPAQATNPNGQPMAPSGVPLGRGAPISAWRGADGVKLCSIGWRNGLFGGATGDGHMRWVCFSDSNGDGALDTAWRSHSSNLGLSFGRRELPLIQPVALLESAPADVEVRTNARATIPEYVFERQIAVTRLEAGSIRITSRLDRSGYKHRIDHRDVPLASPSEVTLSGITVAITPDGRGGATVAARGGFDPGEVRLMCENSRIVIGEMEIATEFTFPNW